MRRVVAVLVALGLAGCGLNVQSPDLFLLTRTGEGQRLTMLVNDGGTVTCNGGVSRNLPGPLLLQARDLANSLDVDAKAKLRLPRSRRSIYQYDVKLQDGSISFPDTAGASHKELAQAELFAVQVAQGPCRSRP